MAFVERIQNMHNDIIKYFTKSNGVLSNDEREAIENLVVLCDRVLAVEKSVRQLNEWKENI